MVGALQKPAPGFSSPNVRHFHLGQGNRIFRSDLRITVISRTPDAPDRLRDFLVCGSAAQHGPKIKPLDPEQAGVETAFGRETGAGAGTTKCLCDRSDHTDLAAAILVTPAFGNFALIVW